MTLTNTKGKTEGVGCGCEAQSGERKAIGVEPATKDCEPEAPAPNRGADPGLAANGGGGPLLCRITMQMTFV